MKQQNLSEISRASGKSVSTVSKVLRGCGGVDAETRQAVLCAAADAGGRSYALTGNDIFVILPDNPKYFWQKAVLFLRHSKTPVTLRLFSAIKQENGNDLVEHYIDEAVASGARALILASHLSERTEQRLADLAKRMLILQLCEYEPIPNTFFVGSDGARDGEALAHSIDETDSSHPIRVGIMTGALSYTGIARIEGFVKHLPDNVHLYFVEKPRVNELYASHLARSIDALGAPLDYLFCFDGITAAACDALYKLREKMRTRLIGFECPPAAEKHLDAGRIAALAVQSLEDQMELALSLAERYVRQRIFPDQKYCYVPSRIIRTNNESEARQ